MERAKITDHDRALVELADSELGKPFKWGRRDCVSVAMRGLSVVYGKNLFPKLQKWTDEKSAIKAVKAVGSLEAECRRRGGRQIPIAFAHTGDIVLYPPSNAEPLGTALIVIGRQMLSASKKEGVRLHPINYFDESAICMRFCDE